MVTTTSLIHSFTTTVKGDISCSQKQQSMLLASFAQHGKAQLMRTNSLAHLYLLSFHVRAAMLPDGQMLY